MSYTPVEKDLVQTADTRQTFPVEGLNLWSVTLRKLVAPVSTWINYVGVIAVAIMLFLTATDVTLRYILRKPITGSVEITEFMMLVMVSLGMANTGMKKGHIFVDAVMQHLPSRAQLVLNITTSLLSIGICAMYSWRSAAYGESLRTGHYLSSALFIPTFPFAYIASIGAAVLCLVMLCDLLEYLAKLTRGTRWWIWSPLVLLPVAITVLFALPVLNVDWQAQIPPIQVGIIGMIIMVLMLFSAMPIGMSMALVGFVGMSYLITTDPALTMLGTTFFGSSASYSFSVMPLFILMGLLCFYSGMSNGLYDTVYKWIGRLPGGLAMATIGACAGFACVSGSTVATAVTMGTVALPEMKRHRYDPALATGCVSAGGCLGILIPPSTILAVYGILTEQSIGKLFMAGFIPGVIEALLFIITIYIICKRNPLIGPPGEGSKLREKIGSLKHTWQTILLFLIVIGGLYMGVFTPTEAAGVGAFGAFLIAVSTRSLSWRNFLNSLLETCETTAMVFVILIGANVLNYFLTVTRLPQALSDGVAALAVNRYIIMIGIILLYMFLGCIMSALAMILLTVPIFLPLVTGMGFDPIWFGVIIVLMCEIGAITPPVGLNVFVIKGIAKEVPMYTIFRGIVPFLIADCVLVVLLLGFPQIATFLPGMMK